MEVRSYLYDHGGKQERFRFEDTRGGSPSMKTKDYLFASITSALILLLVVPLLSARLWTTDQALSIASLSFFSMSLGGATAETFEIAKDRSSLPRLQRNAKRYFLSVVCSSLFYLFVARPLTLALDANNLFNLASASALFTLSLGLGGLATDGFFAIFKTTPPASSNSSEKIEIQKKHTLPTEDGVVDALLGKRLGGK